MWNSIIEHFQTLEDRPVERSAILAGLLLVFWIIEGVIPLMPGRYKKTRIRHAGLNLIFWSFFLLIHFVLAIFIVMLSDWCRDNHFGLVYWLNAGVALTLIISLLAQDLGNYIAHFILHKVRFLWPMHIIHHSDNNVDVTTGFRHHPLDSFSRGVFFVLMIGVSGAPMYAVMIYQTLAAFFTLFTHSNISLPPKLDRAISYFFVSPNMHKVHHHRVQPYTDSNYGDVFALWDRLFGTYRKLDPKDIDYGLDRYYPNEKDEDFVALIKKPFQKLDS